MDPNKSNFVKSLDASNGSNGESYIEKILSSAAKVKFNSFHFIDTQSLQDRMKLKLNSTDTTDLNSNNYLPKLSRKEIMNPFDEYLSLPRVKLDDYSKSINQMLSQKIEDILKNNIQVLLIGAGIGAAVTAGVALGLVCVGSIIHATSVSSWWESITYRIKKRVFSSQLNDTVENETHNNTEDVKGQSISLNSKHLHEASTGKGYYTLTVIQGKPIPQVSSSLATAESQCRQCLDSISANLNSMKRTWNDVIKMNVTIVSGKFKASSVRAMLDEYMPGSLPSLSIAYVMQLEDEHSSIEMEVWLGSP
jgi:enamine deaminase RidA (YjgF/YER057c/UK114 family)